MEADEARWRLMRFGGGRLCSALMYSLALYSRLKLASRCNLASIHYLLSVTALLLGAYRHRYLPIISLFFSLRVISATGED